MKNTEMVRWKCKTRLEKRHGDINECKTLEDRLKFLDSTPYEIIENEGNLLLNCGADIIWDLVTGDSALHFDNANTTIGIGDDNTAAAPAQTDLIGANKKYNAMEATYPTTTTQKATFKSSFGAAEANYAWNEWVIKRTTCLNRKVESLGTKAGGTWTLEVNITLS